MTLTRRQILTRSLIGAGVAIVATIVLFVSDSPEPPRTFMNQHRAVASIQSVILAERAFAAEHTEPGFACSFEELASIDAPDGGKEPRVDRVLASGEEAGYRFRVSCDANPAGRATAYTVTAVPTQPGVTGIFALCSDQGGEIWFSASGSISDCLAARRPIDSKYR